jgi:hypothetical protein
VNNDLGQSFRSKLLYSPWVRLCFGLISAIATYFQYEQAGRTLLFWILCGVTIIVALLTAVPLVLKWRQERKRREAMKRLYYDHQQKVKTLTELIEEFATLEKARCLADTIKGNVRVVAILPVEEGKIGVMLNIGKKENLQVGTQLLVRRINHYTSDGQHIERPLCLAQVTYVQAENNCSQAVVLDWSDREFWDQAIARLRREKRIDPPRNFAVPYIPPELYSLSLEDLKIIRQSLEAICDSLTRIELDQVVQNQEEGL